MASVKDNHPHPGKVLLQGHLRAQGLHVQRNRLRTAIHQSDPLGAETRRGTTYSSTCLFGSMPKLFMAHRQ